MSIVTFPAKQIDELRRPVRAIDRFRCDSFDTFDQLVKIGMIG